MRWRSSGGAVSGFGPSGAGKTTHYLRWKLRYGEELRLLNGDKPLLEIPPEGAITVHPSPWYGKEGMQQYFSGPLGGIILLEKAVENRTRTASAARARWSRHFWSGRRSGCCKTAATAPLRSFAAIPCQRS